jgi:hypothetical protein
MRNKNLLIVIGGDRTGNYETMAPIVNELAKSFNYEILTVIQEESLFNKVNSSLVLSKVFCSNKCFFIKRDFFGIFHNLIAFFSLVFQVFKYKKISLLTNRKDSTFKFYVLYKILSLFSARRYYTSSNCRSPKTNPRQILGNTKANSRREFLLDYALIPTKGHSIEYGVVGYKYDQLVVTGYPKFYPSWKNYLSSIIEESNPEYSDVLFVFTKEYSELKKVIFEVLLTIMECDNFNKIILKPHPTMSFEDLLEIINDIKVPNDKQISISEENVAFLSFGTKTIISFATSAAYDAKIFDKHLINYYTNNENFVNKCRNNEFNTMDNFEIMSSSIACDFIADDICFGVEELKYSLEHLSLNNASTDIEQYMSDTLKGIENLHEVFL